MLFPIRTLCSLLVGTWLAHGCTEFPDPQLGLCGNRILEADEDCDDPDALTCDEKCRIVCQPLAEDTGCPPDKLCGLDETCRAPSGSFEAAIRFDRGRALWIEAGDLDGNRKADLVVQFDDPEMKEIEPDIEVIHLDMMGLTAIHLDDDYGIAAVGGLAGDGRDDVLVAHVASGDPDGDATSLGLLGEVGPDRAPVAATFATLKTDGDIARLLAVTPERDRVLEIVSPTLTRRWIDGASEALVMDTPIAIDASTLGLAVAFADLDGAGKCSGGLDVADFPEPEVAFASKGDGVVHIASTCGATDPLELDYKPDVVLPEGVLGKAGSFFADTNGDDILDLLVQASLGDVLVAYGVGDGTFHSDPAVPVAAGDGVFAALPFWSTDQTDTLFGVADFDGDGTVELVTAKHWVGAPESCMGECPYAWPDALKTAVAIDINDNDRLDVVGIHGETLVVHLLVPEELRFNSHDIELAGIGRQLSIGDFDRDTVADVAFLEVDDAAPSTSAQHVSVLYGGPVQPWRMEQFGPFVQVETLAVEREQTIVARTKDGLGRPAGAFIRPDATAQDFGLAIRQPVLVRTGADLVAASIVLPPNGAERLAHFGFRAGTLSPHDVVVGPELVGMAAGTGAAALAAAIDLVEEPAGIDELVVLGTTAQGGTVWVAQLDPPSGVWSIIDTLTVAQGAFARRPLVTDPDAAEPPPGPGSTLAIGDYDGDGDPDVLATLDRLVPTVVAFRNDAGALTHSPLVLFSEQTSFEYAHIEPWHEDATGKQRWLAAGDEGVGIFVIDPDNKHIEFDEVESSAASALASADVDGDGLLDLVIGTAHEIRIHLAEERVGAL